MRMFIMEPTHRYDLSGLSGFGEVVHICENRIPVLQPTEALAALEHGLEEKCFDPSQDCLVMTGYALVVALGLAATLKKYPKILIAIFSAQDGNYVIRPLDNRSVDTERTDRDVSPIQETSH